MRRGREVIGLSQEKRNPRPEAGREQTTLRLPAELKAELQREAEQMGISFNELVLMILNGEKNRPS